MVLDDEPVREGLSRRGFIRAAGAAAVGGWALGKMGLAVPARASGIDGSQPVSMAMHIHSSFSEQSGSMDAHLYQAQRNAVDVLWWTDHDHRMLESGYRQVVHFTSLTAETTDGNAWQWQQRTSGPLVGASSSGSIVTSPASPNDPIAGGSLALSAKSSSSSPASLGFYAESHPAGWNYHCNLYGQSWTIDVLPSSVGSGGYLELLIQTSLHRAKGGRPAGIYTLSYRFGGPGVPGSRVANGIHGIITLPVVSGQWNTASITPSDDIAALWPDMQVHDFASYGLYLNAVSLGAQTSGYFDYLRFARQYNTGNIPVQTQQQMMSAYALSYPDVTQYQGLEVSGFEPHVNWFGGAVTLGDYSGVTRSNYQNFLRQEVATIHAGGGVASYNHPFGASGGPLLSAGAQDSRVSQTAAALLANNVLDTDLMEVGYYVRGGCDLMHHLKLWDVMSRHARFLTGNGVTDDHFGASWLTTKNNFYTSVWAGSRAEPGLVSGLRAGRAWCASLPRFRGTLDLVADGLCPMGSASISQATTRQLQVIATGLPTGGSIQVLRGVVDYTGTTANTVKIGSFAASALSGGSVVLAIDTSTSCFLRTQVLDSNGLVVALSNPIWLLRGTPPTGIPAARAC